jgi:hypothetical protein
LGEVEELRTKEAVLKAEEQRHLDLIAASEGEVRRCDDELGEIRENQLRLLRREMDGLRDELFPREDEEAVAVDEAHIPTDGEAQNDSEAKRAWNARARLLKSVT